MAIEHRSLAPGTQLSASYKKQAYTCSVEAGEDGKLVFVLADASRHTSPSAAGSAVMGGIACNGWRFWSLAGQEPLTARAQANAPKDAARAKGTSSRTLKKLPNQNGAPKGQVRYFCSGCMAGFTAPDGAVPRFCPEGHSDEPVVVTSA